MPKNDWTAYKELFLHEMRENGKHFIHITYALENLNKDLGAVKIDVGRLKVRATIAGGIAGLIGTGLITIIIALWG